MNVPRNETVADIIARLLTPVVDHQDGYDFDIIILSEEDEEILDGMLGADLEVDCSSLSSDDAAEYFASVMGIVDLVPEDDRYEEYQASDFDDNGDLIISEISSFDEKTGIRTYTLVTKAV